MEIHETKSMCYFLAVASKEGYEYCIDCIFTFLIRVKVNCNICNKMYMYHFVKRKSFNILELNNRRILFMECKIFYPQYIQCKLPA